MPHGAAVLSLYQHLSVNAAGIKNATELLALCPNHNKQTDFKHQSKAGWLAVAR